MIVSFLLEQVFSYKMDHFKDLDSNLNIFNRLLLNLTNYKVNFSDEHSVVVLLNSLHDTYREVKSAIKYGRDELTINIVVNAFRSKDGELKSEIKSEILSVKDRPSARTWNSTNSRSKSRESNRSKIQS